MPKKGVPYSVRNHQRLEYLITSSWYMKLFQQGSIEFFKTQPSKREYLEYMPEGNLETQLPLIRARFGLPEKMAARSYLPLTCLLSHDKYVKPRSIEEILRWNVRKGEDRFAFLESLSTTDMKKFAFSIKWIALSHDLDFTWYPSISDMIISGYYMAPYYNLRISPNSEEKELSLQLTSTTSLEDIKYAQEAIKGLQIAVFGVAKKGRYSAKRIALAELIRASDETIGQTEEYYEPTTDKTVMRRKTLEDALAFFEDEGKIKDLSPKKRRLFKQKIRTGISRKKKLVK